MTNQEESSVNRQTGGHLNKVASAAEEQPGIGAEVGTNKGMGVKDTWRLRGRQAEKGVWGPGRLTDEARLPVM